MGVLNVTPDSFSDGGLYTDLKAAVKRAVQMAEEGADIIDIGGESTRPATFHDGAPLYVDEELKRVVPIIKEISRQLPGFPLSIDTYKSAVAVRALDAGATIINDISGLTFDPAMAIAAAEFGCPIVIMHLLGQPRNILTPIYNDVVGEISTYFKRQVSVALRVGVEENQIILDPGIGFGKNLKHNLIILRRLAEFQSLGFPVMIGPSRKRFLGKLLDDAPTDERIEGTSAAVAIGIANGAAIVRVHDVESIAKVVKVADAIVRNSEVSSSG